MPDSDIWRYLPPFLEPTQKLRLEALVYSCDSLVRALEPVLGFCEEYGVDIGRASRPVKGALFDNLWRSVDAIHAIRVILNTMLDGDPGPTQRAYLEKYSAVRVIRNRFDHLDQNISNLAKREGSPFPVFGSFSYFVSSPDQPISDDGSAFLRGTSIVLGSGYATGDSMRMQFATPGVEDDIVPVSHHRFHAFDEELPLDRVLKDTKDVLDPIRLEIHEQFNRQLAPLTIDSREVRGPRFGGATSALQLSWPISFRK